MNNLKKISNEFAVAYNNLNEVDKNSIGIYVATEEAIQNHKQTLGFVKRLNELGYTCDVLEKIENFKNRYLEIDDIEDDEIRNEKVRIFYNDACKFTGKYYLNCLLALIQNWDVYKELN